MIEISGLDDAPVATFVDWGADGGATNIGVLGGANLNRRAAYLLKPISLVAAALTYTTAMESLLETICLVHFSVSYNRH